MCSSHKEEGMAKIFCDVFCSLWTALLEHSISYIGHPSLLGQGTKPGYEHLEVGTDGASMWGWQAYASRPSSNHIF